MFFLQNCINIYAAYQLDLRRGVRCLNQMDIFLKWQNKYCQSSSNYQDIKIVHKADDKCTQI